MRHTLNVKTTRRSRMERRTILASPTMAGEEPLETESDRQSSR
jgi:hypothetical protein